MRIIDKNTKLEVEDRRHRLTEHEIEYIQTHWEVTCLIEYSDGLVFPFPRTRGEENILIEIDDTLYYWCGISFMWLRWLINGNPDSELICGSWCDGRFKYMVRCHADV